MGLDCNALLLTDFSLKHSKTCGLPQLSSEWEWNRFLKPTTPTTTNCRLHQEIDNLSVSENWHLIAKGRLVTSVLKNLSYCLQCCTWSADNEKTSGSRTVRLTPLTSCKSLGGGGFFIFSFFKQTLMATADHLAPAIVHCHCLQPGFSLFGVRADCPRTTSKYPGCFAGMLPALQSHTSNVQQLLLQLWQMPPCVSGLQPGHHCKDFFPKPMTLSAHPICIFFHSFSVSDKGCAFLPRGTLLPISPSFYSSFSPSLSMDRSAPTFPLMGRCSACNLSPFSAFLLFH